MIIEQKHKTRHLWDPESDRNKNKSIQIGGKEATVNHKYKSRRSILFQSEEAYQEVSGDTCL